MISLDTLAEHGAKAIKAETLRRLREDFEVRLRNAPETLDFQFNGITFRGEDANTICVAMINTWAAIESKIVQELADLGYRTSDQQVN